LCIHFVASLSILLWWLVDLCIRLWSAVMQRAFSYAWIRFPVLHGCIIAYMLIYARGDVHKCSYMLL